MTLNEALAHFKTKTALAKALGITKQAVSRWEEDKPIPELYEMKLRYKILPRLAKKRTATA